MVIWLTGLSGSGKTTIAKAIYKKIKNNYLNTVFLDGDIIRKALNNSWGYSIAERLKGARQIHGLCKILDNEDIIVVCATMSLFKEIHNKNRAKFSAYLEVFLDVDMKILIKRDKKSLYSNALSGNEDNVVGVNLSYDKPNNAELYLNNNIKSDLSKNIKTILVELNNKYNLKLSF